MSVFPTWLMPATVPDQSQSNLPTYLSSWAFDFGVEDFVVDGTGTVESTDGYTAWAHWCVKACIIQRNVYPIYDFNYGCDIDSITGAGSRSEAESNAEEAITNALMADPRTGSVSNFTFAWSGDALTIAFSIVPTVTTMATINVQLTYS